MSDAEAAPAAPAPAKKTPKKKAASKGPKKAASHPKYSDMVKKAVATLKERGGSSRQAIIKYILANYKVDADKVGRHVKTALIRGVKSGSLKQSKGTGASGSFRLGDKAEKKPKAKKATKPKAAKPKAKKVKKPKAAGAKKSPKKAKKPKAKKPAGEKKVKAAKPKAKKPKAKKAKTPKKAAKK